MLYAIVPFKDFTLPLELFEESISQTDNVELKLYTSQHPNIVFASFKGTSSELAKALGLAADPEKEDMRGQCIIMRIRSYFGYGPASLWEWMDAHGER